jgi:hypothetical protein
MTVARGEFGELSMLMVTVFVLSFLPIGAIALFGRGRESDDVW